MRNSIDITNYVSITTTVTPAGLPQFNPNIVGFFTTESFIAGNRTDIYRNYINASSVATDFGTNSSTYSLATKLFAQSPNILTGRGSLNIIPMLSAVSATNSVFTTENIVANLTGLLAVTDGRIMITVDEQVFNLTNLNFTQASSWQQVANIFLSYVQGYANVSVLTVANVPSGLIFTSKKVGTTASIVLTANAGTGTDLAEATYLNIVAGASSGATASSGETLLEAITRTQSEVAYLPFFTNLAMEDSYILSVATSTQAKQQMYMQEVASLTDLKTAGIATLIAEANLNKTRILGHFVSLADAQNFKVGYIGRMFSVNFAGNNTALTANLKALSGISIDTVITDSILTQCKNAGVDTYPNTAGNGYVNAQGNANDYFDNQYNAVWFNGDLQITLFNVLQQAGIGTKIAQTQQGMTILRNAIISVCEQGVRNQMIGQGLRWSGTIPFGDPVKGQNAIFSQGYYIYQPPIALQPQGDRGSRIAPLFQIAVKLSGAVHFVQIQATLQQ